MKLKKHLALILALAMLSAAALSGAAFAEDTWNGTVGTVPQPVGDIITITTGAQLAALAADVNSGNTYKDNTIRLGDDINLNNHSWTPIGYFTGYKSPTLPNPDNKPFKGIFDGAGHTIRGLNVAVTNMNQGHTAALFGYVEYVKQNQTKDKALAAARPAPSAGEIWAAAHEEALARGLAPEEANIFAMKRADAVETFGVNPYAASAARGIAPPPVVSKGTVKNLIVKGSVSNTAGGGASGIVCWNDGKIQNCRFEGTVSATQSLRAYVGGVSSLIGEYASIQNCVTSVDVTALGTLYSYGGGILGFCYVSTTSSDIFDAYGSIANCSVEQGSTINSQMDAGGVIGGFAYKVYNCSSAASNVLVNGQPSGTYRGGIVGGFGAATNCYWHKGTNNIYQPTYAVGGTTITTGRKSTAASLPIASVHFASPLSVSVGQNKTITRSYYPSVAGANTPTLPIWASDKVSVATVSSGVVHGVSPGSATIKGSGAGSPAWQPQQASMCVMPECYVTVTP
ncbi:hypothetical protein [Synergistes jonesii]|uniref:hypothetical protein n=1 Tax=Synergistes jonesii TaxID=2754 RepID=UPI00332833D5